MVPGVFINSRVGLEEHRLDEGLRDQGTQIGRPAAMPLLPWTDSDSCSQQQLKDEFFAELNSAKSAAAEETAAKKASAGATVKAKPKLKKKAGADDPFASGDDEELCFLGNTITLVQSRCQRMGHGTHLKPWFAGRLRDVFI